MSSGPGVRVRWPRWSRGLTVAVAFTLITFALYEGARIVPWLVLSAANHAEWRLVIIAAGSFVGGALFFSSPALWLRIWVPTTGAHAQSILSDPSWLVTAYVVGPFFIYGALHGLFVKRELTRAQLAKAVVGRYLVTWLVVSVVGLVMGLIAIAHDS